MQVGTVQKVPTSISITSNNSCRRPIRLYVLPAKAYGLDREVFFNQLYCDMGIVNFSWIKTKQQLYPIMCNK